MLLPNSVNPEELEQQSKELGCFQDYSKRSSGSGALSWPESAADWAVVPISWVGTAIIGFGGRSKANAYIE